MRAYLSLLLIAALTASPALARSRTVHKAPRVRHHAPAKQIKHHHSSGRGSSRGGGSNDNG